MKYFSACWLLAIFVLTACERSVKPPSASQKSPTGAGAPTVVAGEQPLPIGGEPDEDMRRRRELEQFNVAMERERAKLRPPPSPIPPSLPSVRQLDDRPYVDNLDRVPPGFARSNNLYCPVMQKVRLKPHVMVEYAVEFDDMTIGFCCEDCVEAWKAMDDAERRERVKTVMAKK